jgi:hypothetical protein
VFASLLFGLIFLLIAELQAPYNSNLYLNPQFYIIFFGLLGIALFGEYMIATEMFFSHLRPLYLIGILGFIGMQILYIISGIILLTMKFTTYPIVACVAFESTYYFGIVACLMFGIGSIQMGCSDRLEGKSKRNMLVIGVIWLINALYHGWLAWGLLFIDLSIQFDISLSIFMLMWICGESIIYIYVMYKFFKYLG